MANIKAGQANIVVARRDATFQSMGLSESNTNIIYEAGESLKSWIPGRPINQMQGLTAGMGYYFISKTDIDLKQYFIPPGSLDWQNVTDYKTTSNNWYDAFTAAIAVIGDVGGIIYVPAGIYDMTGLPTIQMNKNVHIMGAGGRNGATQIITTTPSQVIFDVNVAYDPTDPKAYGFKFNEIFMENYSNATSGSSAIKISSGFGFRLEDCFFRGFYDTIDVVKSYYWSMQLVEATNATRWSVRIRDVGLEDGGDACIDNCWFGATTGQPALIRYESGGGLKMTNTKFNAGSSACARAFDMVFSGVSLDLLFTNNSFENFTERGVSLDLAVGGQFSGLSLIGNEFLQSIANTKGIYIKGMDNVTMMGNTFASSGGSSGTAIDIVNCHNVRLFNTYNGYSGSTPVKVSGSTNVKRAVEEDIASS